MKDRGREVKSKSGLVGRQTGDRWGEIPLMKGVIVVTEF